MARAYKTLEINYLKIAWNFLCIASGILCLVNLSNGHPQCLDSRPPFQSAGNQFCMEYEQYGCCTPYDDQVLRMRYERIKMLIPQAKQHLWTTCADYAKIFLCQTCSPYAAHIFDAEATTGYQPEPRVFPGLCKGYCSTFYQQCKDLVEYYMDEAGSAYAGEAARLTTTLAVGETEFCDSAHIVDLDYCYPELLTNPILNGNISIEKVTQEGCICVQAYDTISFRNPVFLRHAGDGSNRMFVGEQIGLVHIMYPNGTLLEEPFLDIRNDIKTTSSKGDERGMLGMAFHPNFTANGKFYIYYSTFLSSTEEGFANHKIRIEEFKVLPDSPNKVDYNYSRIILEVYEPFWNHNGGEVGWHIIFCLEFVHV